MRSPIITYTKAKNRFNLELRFALRENINETGISVFAIFDGHGDDFVAEFCKEKLLENICQKALKVKNFSKNSFDDVTDNKIDAEISELGEFFHGSSVDYGKIMTSEILVADQKLVDELKEVEQSSGSTAIIAVLDGSKLTVANVGDSRGVMLVENGTTIPLSFDHKPDDEREKLRIEQAGGFVAMWGVWRVNGSLAVSRAIGDYYLKPNLVIANPDVLLFDLLEYK